MTGPIIGNNKTNEDPIPAYFKLQMTLQEEIENGRWEVGQTVPTERVLAEVYQVSIGTVKRAILGLVNKGYLYRIQGKGTFVAGTTLRKEDLSCPYYRLRKGFKDQEADMRAKLLGLNLIQNFEPANQHLNIKPNQKVFEIKRVFLLDGKPTAYTISYLPQRLFRNLQKIKPSTFEEVPLCMILEKDYGLPTRYKEELFGVVEAGAEIAGILEIAKGSGILFIEMLAFTYKDRAYEYRRGYCLTTDLKVFRKT